eukprot:gene6715-4812_t
MLTARAQRRNYREHLPPLHRRSGSATCSPLRVVFSLLWYTCTSSSTQFIATRMDAFLAASEETSLDFASQFFMLSVGEKARLMAALEGTGRLGEERESPESLQACQDEMAREIEKQLRTTHHVEEIRSRGSRTPPVDNLVAEDLNDEDVVVLDQFPETRTGYIATMFDSDVGTVLFDTLQLDGPQDADVSTEALCRPPSPRPVSFVVPSIDDFLGTSPQDDPVPSVVCLHVDPALDLHVFDCSGEEKEAMAPQGSSSSSSLSSRDGDSMEDLPGLGGIGEDEAVNLSLPPPAPFRHQSADLLQQLHQLIAESSDEVVPFCDADLVEEIEDLEGAALRAHAGDWVAYRLEPVVVAAAEVAENKTGGVEPVDVELGCPLVVRLVSLQLTTHITWCGRCLFRTRNSEEEAETCCNTFLDFVFLWEGAKSNNAAFFVTLGCGIQLFYLDLVLGVVFVDLVAMNKKSVSHSGNGFWQATDFFKGFLTARWRFRQLSFVVLAHIPQNSVAYDRIGSSLDVSKTSLPEEGPYGSELIRPQSPNPFSSPVRNPNESPLEFFLVHRDDVETPSAKYITEPSKIDRCFFMCERDECRCKSLHVRKDAWRIRLDTLEQKADLVCYSEERIERLKDSDILPTAGYYYALGLLYQGFASVFPRICPLGPRCARGKTCLFIHLTHALEEVTVPLQADIPLAALQVKRLSNTVRTMLSVRGLDNVGDMQMMSNEAFDALVGQAPQELLDELLSVSTCRFFDQYSSLAKVLSTFPHMPEDYIEQINCFPKVSDVLKLTPSELYSRPVAVEITSAFEIIRKRLEPEDPFTSLHLEDLDNNAFIPRALTLILETARKYAHWSWRRHDPKRPVVTSMITFVDVGKCQCGRPAHVVEDDEPWEYNMEDYGHKECLPAPHGSWCDCPRFWDVAVNYELNTPMGSRCSEQNVMAAIARSGAPTWSIREVVVHGNKANAEMNPLFPCGVCENMLRKAEKDVRQYFGKHIMLYMFDATVPKKVFSLPVREISLRDNPRAIYFTSIKKKTRLKASSILPSKDNPSYTTHMLAIHQLGMHAFIAGLLCAVATTVSLLASLAAMFVLTETH